MSLKTGIITPTSGRRTNCRAFLSALGLDGGVGAADRPPRPCVARHYGKASASFLSYFPNRGASRPCGDRRPPSPIRQDGIACRDDKVGHLDSFAPQSSPGPLGCEPHSDRAPPPKQEPPPPQRQWRLRGRTLTGTRAAAAARSRTQPSSPALSSRASSSSWAPCLPGRPASCCGERLSWRRAAARHFSVVPHKSWIALSCSMHPSTRMGWLAAMGSHLRRCKVVALLL